MQHAGPVSLSRLGVGKNMSGKCCLALDYFSRFNSAESFVSYVVKAPKVCGIREVINQLTNPLIVSKAAADRYLEYRKREAET